MSNVKLVYSTDPKENQKCSECKELKSECTCTPQDSADKAFTAVLRIEKGGRGGKIVTVIDGLPRNEAYLKELTKDLKVRCGTGGTFVLGDKAGIIEIQGDKKEQLRKLLEAKKIRVKG